MDPMQGTLLFAAGLLTGAFNAAAGGGSLIGFSALITAGVPPLTAKLTSTVTVLPGNVASVAGGYRDLPARREATRILPAAVLGGIAGSLLLLQTPTRIFDAIVPFLVLAASAVLGLQHRLAKLVERPAINCRREHPATLQALVAASGVYGGYIGAGFGIVLLASLTLLRQETLNRTVVLKNLLAAAVSLTTAALYVLFGTINWTGVAILAPATVIGGYGGARLLRKFPPALLKGIIVAYGVTFGLVLLGQNVLQH
ncbi:sulfite exporter TauE/SafE family protein [Polymorphospora lycopeni]|uniref:Probable membrane transporter protein n=1 Tax=Polymorphospora lycopeni TaxID=3140240 RepID=A0ABV5CXR9_9ACTN